MFDSFTNEAKQAMNLARQCSQANATGYLDAVHVLVGCCRAPESLAAKVILGCGQDPVEVCARAEMRARSLSAEGAGFGQIPFTHEAKRVLEGAMTEAAALGHRSIGTHHLLLAIVRSKTSLGEMLRLGGLRSSEVARHVDRVHAEAGEPRSEAKREQARFLRRKTSEDPAKEFRREHAQDSIFAGDLHGRLEPLVLRSPSIRSGLASEPDERELNVYLPWKFDDERHLPVVFLLASFTSHARDFLETHPWRRGVIAELDAQIARGECEPAIVVMPDCWTRFGGSQYVDSEYLGGFETYVARELVKVVDERFPTLSGRRAIAGKSSGGFGALRLAMRHPDVFPIAASISGDCDFEASLGPELYACLRGLVPFGGDPARFLEDFTANPSLDGDRHAVINVLAMAACYSPNPKSPLGFDLPMDLRTGARIESVWQRWLAFDPLHECERYADNLKQLELLHLECGLRDEYHLQWGLRKLADKLRALGVNFDHEEHEGSHRGISKRYQVVLPKLIRDLHAR